MFERDLEAELQLLAQDYPWLQSLDRYAGEAEQKIQAIHVLNYRHTTSIFEILSGG